MITHKEFLEEQKIVDACYDQLNQSVFDSRLVLYHGTNRRIANLRCESFLSEDIEDAVFFAQLKNGGTVYQFIVNENDVYRDTGTLQKRWYLSRKKLKPVRAWSV
jgi:hypothetical protein